MRGKTRGLLAMVLGVALALGAALGVAPREALAGTETYTSLIPTGDELGTEIEDKKVTFNGKEWYIIADESSALNAGTLTLLAKDVLKDGDNYVQSEFHDSSNAYSGSTVKGYLDGLTAEGGSFSGVKDAIAGVDLTDVTPNVEGAKLYLLSAAEAGNVPKNVRLAVNNWWLRSPGAFGDEAKCVYGSSGNVDGWGTDVDKVFGVRPALKLNLESVIFESESRTFSLPVKVTDVTLNPSAAQTIDVGGKVTFTATVSPAEAMDKTVTWSSSDEGVATVEDGVVTGVAPGTATITCTSNADETKFATCEVTVSEPAPDDIALTGSGHVQKLGDVAAKASGKGILIGTTGESRRLEQFTVSLPKDTDGGIEYRAHLQGKGWADWVADGAPCGTAGQSRRVEAVQMRLAGKLSDTHSVWYRAHSQTFGWLGWACDGQAAGTAGQSKRVEAVEVQVLPKGQRPEGYEEGQASYVGAATGRAHVQGVGWASPRDPLELGTTGKGRRLEAIRLSVPNQPADGGISYEVHAQGIGWMPAAADGALAGTEGQSRRLEAVRISLTGDLAREGNYSVWYRVHSQTYGWLGWAHDGQDAGTAGLAKRAEAIDVQVLPQGQVPRGYDASKAACVTK